jgi:hypothetical protein
LCAYQAIAREIEVRGLSKDDVTIMDITERLMTVQPK